MSKLGIKEDIIFSIKKLARSSRINTRFKDTAIVTLTEANDTRIISEIENKYRKEFKDIEESFQIIGGYILNKDSNRQYYIQIFGKVNSNKDFITEYTVMYSIENNNLSKDIQQAKVGSTVIGSLSSVYGEDNVTRDLYNHIHLKIIKKGNGKFIINNTLELNSMNAVIAGVSRAFKATGNTELGVSAIKISNDGRVLKVYTFNSSGKIRYIYKIYFEVSEKTTVNKKEDINTAMSTIIGKFKENCNLQVYEKDNINYITIRDTQTYSLLTKVHDYFNSEKASEHISGDPKLLEFYNGDLNFIQIIGIISKDFRFLPRFKIVYRLENIELLNSIRQQYWRHQGKSSGVIDVLKTRFGSGMFCIDEENNFVIDLDTLQLPRENAVNLIQSLVAMAGSKQESYGVLEIRMPKSAVYRVYSLSTRDMKLKRVADILFLRCK